MGREDDGLPHGDASQHHGGEDDPVGQAQRDGEPGADQRADERDRHPGDAIGQDGDGERADERRGTGDGDDEQDAGVA